MHLEKLEIQGFKSFAQKTALTFPGKISEDRKGLTAIVGPNGSGKSNVADAIRWVMGEQSLKTLRGKKSEDVIFNGSEKHGKLGMAEVSLHLNNEDRKAPVDFSQVVITRRMYRDGASEYLLNNSRVRLSDIEMLLAKSSFGQKTYSVIGQGMVDGFLNTSLTERKEFFDEATGVKQFQIKRDEALNKLKLSLENLGQAQMLLTEIEPRLGSLTRQVKKLQRKGEIETELKEAQLAYYRKTWHEVKDRFNEVNAQLLELEKTKLEKDKKLLTMQKDLGQMEIQNKISQEFNDLQRELSELQNQKDALSREMAKIEAQIEVKLEASGQFDLSWLNNRKSSLTKEVEQMAGEISSLAAESSGQEVLRQELEQSAQANNRKVSELNASLFAQGKNNKHPEAVKVNERLKGLLQKIESAENENDLEKVRSLIREIREEVRALLAAEPEEENKIDLEKIQYELTEATKEREELTMRRAEISSKLSSLQERKKILEENTNRHENELKEIENKLKKYQSVAGDDNLEQEKGRTNKGLVAVEKKIGETREKINNFSEEERRKREMIFDLQRKMTSLQSELNQVNDHLNELKVNSARYETKLEDMEAEIRAELGGLREIESERVTAVIDLEALQGRIHNLKKQLEAIGALDPEIEKEYIETKERFDFLSGQVDDLTKTINSLEKIIKELDVTIKEKFDKEFKVISEKFLEYFKILFGGGIARMIKVTTDELLNDEEKAIESKDVSKMINPETGGVPGASLAQKAEDDKRNHFTEEVYKKIRLLQKYNATGLAGVEIEATPPGKKIKAISLLSGGERALTSIALICAIISANPAPFVVLDEVDAALDEANSERLAKILDDLSHKTQFIVITHNRSSMRRANILYGVTMQDDGMSRLLSVKLDEVKARNEY